MRIADDELAGRREALAAQLVERGLAGCALFDPHYVQYYTGFAFIPTERPLAFVLAADARGGMLVPRLEVEHAQANAAVSEVAHYDEFPGERHPMEALRELLDALGVRGRVGADNDGYPWVFGYRGPSLSSVTGADVVPITEQIESMMARKSEAEIELIRESGRWCAHAHRLLQEYSRPGATEAEVALRVAQESTSAMLAELGDSFGGQLGSADGVKAGYRGQIGLRSSWAHAIAHNIAFEEGDVLVSETGAPVWGYNAELERAMVIGEPTDEMRRLFEHTVAAQQVAFAALRPGVTCGDVDAAVMRYFEVNDLLPYWRQHTGHAIGLRNHEAPFLDVGDPTPVEPGMVFTIEPGLYDSSIGGFRHSDTVVVREDGIELLTEYPRDLESLMIR